MVYNLRLIYCFMFPFVVLFFGYTACPIIEHNSFFHNIISRFCLRMNLGLCLVRGFVTESIKRRQWEAKSSLQEVSGRIDDILSTLMPSEVARDLRLHPSRAALQHPYSDATVVLSDLCGFTELASTRFPEEVVEIISQIFGLFDELTHEFKLYKVETIGDAYLAAQAGPPLTETNSPVGCVFFALALVEAVHRWSEGRRESMSCRVGVHRGPCLGGIVGRDMQRYHLFGGLMTALEVLEATAPSGG